MKPTTYLINLSRRILNAIHRAYRTILAPLERGRKTLSEKVLHGIARLLAAMFGQGLSEKGDNLEGIVDNGGKEATRVVLGITTGVVLLAWVLGIFTEYQISVTIYGLSVAAAGSFILGWTDFSESLPDEQKSENFDVRKLIQRGSGYIIFAIGFGIQVGAMYGKEVGLLPLPITALQLNILFLFVVLFSGILYVRLHDILQTLGFGMLFSLLILLPLTISATFLGEENLLIMYIMLLALAVGGLLAYLIILVGRGSIWAIGIMAQWDHNRLKMKVVSSTCLISVPVLLWAFPEYSHPELLALNHQNPLLYQFYSSAFVHASENHLIGNLTGYTIAILPLYALYTFEQREYSFPRIFGILLLLAPFVTTIASFGVWTLLIDAPINYDLGFSGVVSAFAGLLFIQILNAVETELPPKNANYVLLMVLLALLASWAVLFGGLLQIGMTGMVIVVLAGGAFAFRRGEVSPIGLDAWVREHPRSAIVLSCGLLAALFLIIVSFPAEIQNRGGFTNLVGHGAGFLFGMFFAGWNDPIGK